MGRPAPAVSLRPVTVGDAAEMLHLLLRNRAFLTPWEPVRSASYFTLAAARAEAERAEAERAADAGFAFGMVERASGELVGRVALSNVVRGAWHNATLGYFVDAERGGRGYATEAVRQVLAHAFGQAGLHRVQAAVMPRNGRSLRVVERNGLRLEGVALRYLCINGRWEDHRIYAITREEWPVERETDGR